MTDPKFPLFEEEKLLSKKQKPQLFLLTSFPCCDTIKYCEKQSCKSQQNKGLGIIL